MGSLWVQAGKLSYREQGLAQSRPVAQWQRQDWN